MSVLIVGVGAREGLGAALAERLGREGLKLFVAGRARDKLETTAASLRKESRDVTVLVGDASVEADASSFIDSAERAAPLAVVIHNVGEGT